MLFYTALDLSRHPNKLSVKTMAWMIPQIDYIKLANRIAYVEDYPDKTVKCVLLEYNYTSKSRVLQGYPNIVDYLPNTNMLVHHAVNKPDFVKLMDQFFAASSSMMNVYIRQKIAPDGQPNFHKKQIVLEFEPWAFVPQPAPLPSPIENSCCSDDYSDMPALIPTRS